VIDDKPIVEDQFDNIIKKNDQGIYKFLNPGRRDRQIIRSLNNFGITGKRCMDIGSGTGRWLQYFKRNNPKFLAGMDISQEAINRANKLCNKTQKINLESDSFDFPDNFFDIIISHGVMDHLRDPSNYLMEIKRVSKKNSLIQISVENFVSLLSRIRMVFGMFPRAISLDPTHVGWYRKKEVIHLLQKFELKPVFLPTSISLNPTPIASRLRIPSNKLISRFEDQLLFTVERK